MTVTIKHEASLVQTRLAPREGAANLGARLAACLAATPLAPAIRMGVGMSVDMAESRDGAITGQWPHAHGALVAHGLAHLAPPRLGAVRSAGGSPRTGAAAPDAGSLGASTARTRPPGVPAGVPAGAVFCPSTVNTSVRLL